MSNRTIKVKSKNNLTGYSFAQFDFLEVLDAADVWQLCL